MHQTLQNRCRPMTVVVANLSTAMIFQKSIERDDSGTAHKGIRACNSSPKALQHLIPIELCRPSSETETVTKRLRDKLTKLQARKVEGFILIPLELFLFWRL